MIDLMESDVLLARGGDEAAFHRLVGRCANTVCSIAFAIVRNVHASEDVAQEVFLAAWANLRTLRNPASFMPWLRQVTRNQAHLWRREHLRETSDEALLASVIDAKPTPIESALAGEEERILREVLDAIPDEAREVLVLYYREERSTRQVAELLGLSEPAVRQRLSRSRALMRDELLDRFSSVMRTTAPGAAFATAVAAALVALAPSASAAVAASSASAAAGATATTIVKATLAGGVLGWAGVLMGMRALNPVFDEREARELRTFRNVVLAVVTIGCAAVAMSVSSVLRTLIAVQTLYIVVGAMYALWLPRILRRRSMRPMIWRAAAAAIAGLIVMAVVLQASA